MTAWLPSVEQKGFHGTREMALKTVHLMDRRIFLTGQVDRAMADSFLEQMLFMGRDPGDPVTVYLDSPGGEVTAGLAIHDIMRASPCRVGVTCSGLAASMAALLLAAGEPGMRKILPHGKVLIHEPLVTEGLSGSASSIRDMAESILATKSVINGLLAGYTGRDTAEIDRIAERNTLFTAEEAVAYGLCDGVTHSL